MEILQNLLTEIRVCTACNKPLKGRTDKKFCDDSCRNNYNNRLKADSNNFVRNINNALGKNRRILEWLYKGRPTRVQADQLLMHGFQFRYYTHQFNRKGDTCYFCYDHGYIQNKEHFIIVKRKDPFRQ